jgi:D-alanyl-lipoteichoic acid acyltransferase DltB (MBOAT superfamily)
VNYNDCKFWLLFFVVLALYWRLSHKQQNLFLLAASYFFYGFWDYRFLTLILLATVIDFVGGLGVAGIDLSFRRLLSLGVTVTAGVTILCSGIKYGILFEGLARLDVQLILSALPARLDDLRLSATAALGSLVYIVLVRWLYRQPAGRRRKLFVAVSMTANLAMLGFFKYCGFFVGSMQHLLDALGLGQLGGAALSVVLPAGISFYTFQAMSYTIDVYRGHANPTQSFSDFALFVCFFPHLVAGPIMRASTLLPQVVEPRRLPNREAWWNGAILILAGLFKKIVIADNMAPIANRVFFHYLENPSVPLSAWEILVGVYAFAFQIYGDFSGYSSIARGISKWLGFDLVVNFHLPYFAVSPSDFWRRWHISLSTWLRDYLYIPLGGNRKGGLATYRNLMLTMVLGGLWHGANWTFVAWGVYHGILLCGFRLFRVRDVSWGTGLGQRIVWVFRAVLMFNLTCFGWLLFRADNFQVIYRMCADLATNWQPASWAVAAGAFIAFYCCVGFLIELFTDGENRLDRILQSAWCLQAAIVVYWTIMLLFFQADEAHEFIYFQF